MISRLVAILISSYLLSTLVPAQQLRPSICIEPGHRYAYWLSVAFSPDGKCVLSSSGSCSRLWDTRTGKTIGVAEGHTIMASSPGGKLLIGGRLYASFKDIATGKSPRLLEYDGPRGIWSAAFSPDGRYVLAGCTDGTSRLWDTEAPSGDATLRAFREFEDHGKLVFTTVAFSPDGKYVISEGDDTILRLWDFATGKVIKRFRHAGLVRSVAFSPDGKYALLGHSDRTVKLWEIAKGRTTRTFRGHTDEVRAAVFSPDGKHILSGSDDETMRLWDAATGHEIRRFQVFDPVWSVAISRDERYCLSGGNDGTPRLWELATGERIRSFRELFQEVDSVAVSPGGDSILLGSRDGILRLWDLARDKGIRIFKGHSASVGMVAFSPDGKLAVSGQCRDRTIRLWSIESGSEIRRISPSWWGALSPDGKNVLYTYGRNMRLLDLASGKEIRTFRGHTDSVLSAVFSPDGRRALSTSCDKTLRLWDVASGRKLRILLGHAGPIPFASFSPDGRCALSIEYQGPMILWDLAGGKEIRRYKADPRGPALFSPDGRYALSRESSVVLRAIATSEYVRSFSHRSFSGTNSIAFFPDGKHALSGGWDCTAKIWNIERDEEICSLVSVGEDGWAIVAPDGRFDASPDAMKHLSYYYSSERNHQFSLEQLKDRYYEPGLLSKLMGHNREPLRKNPSLESVKPCPEIFLLARESVESSACSLPRPEMSSAIGEFGIPDEQATSSNLEH